MLFKWLRFFAEELTFLKSRKDIGIFYNQKLPFLKARFLRNAFVDAQVPPCLQLEPCNYCNVNCICCPNDKMKREKGFMEFELFRKIVDDAAEIGVMRIHLYLHGEAMIHPHIVEMISYIKQKRIGISMHTNGTLFNRELIGKILKSGVNSGDYFIFSILGYSKKVHERIMKGINHDKIIYNVKQFKKLRKQKRINGPIIEVLFYRMAENQNEEEPFVKYWRRIADHVHPVGKISESFAAYNRNAEKEPSFSERKKSCKLLWERMAVFWNGEVTICAEDLDGKQVLGNLGSNTIKEIWNGEKMKHIKRLHKEGLFDQLSLCSRCDQ